ncbi:hypothetical protein GJ744_000198 [Endocarpon pusillum]|uniref:Uncharacterized protein n=1 Tax=Endocarpon pusillum TaxID=364733 RepID=A0A8H7ASJ9_9EURO|nr:hypothetical protein GJ744_000198 [Endocarpon pusillum]
MLQVRHDIVGLRLYFRGGMNYLKEKVSTGPISLMRNNGILKNWFVFDGWPKQALRCGHTLAEADVYLRGSILLALGKRARSESRQHFPIGDGIHRPPL